MTALAPLHGPRAPAPAPDVAGPGSRAPTHGPSATRGHRLAAITVAPRAPTPALELPDLGGSGLGAPIQRQLAPAGGGGVIQRNTWWKRGLAGLGAIGGMVAAAVGGTALAGVGLALSPVLAGGLLAGGGLAALAGGGYLAHQHRFGPGRAELRALRRQHAALANAKKGSREALVRDILGEGLAQMKHTELSPLAVFSGGGEATRQGGRGRYRVRLQPDVRDPVKRRSYLLHELIHVSSDRHYTSNAQEGREFYNVGEGEHLDPSEHYSHPQYEPTRKRADEIYELAKKDEHLHPYHREHIQERMGYIENKPFQERDTVVSDLLYYAHTYGISEQSPTHQAIVKWAREVYHQRHPKLD